MAKEAATQRSRQPQGASPIGLDEKRMGAEQRRAKPSAKPTGVAPTYIRGTWSRPWFRFRCLVRAGVPRQTRPLLADSSSTRFALRECVVNARCREGYLDGQKTKPSLRVPCQCNQQPAPTGITSGLSALSGLSGLLEAELAVAQWYRGGQALYAYMMCVLSDGVPWDGR